jgi:general secretion pathway protein G
MRDLFTAASLRRREGFTLIELMIVMVIIVLLASIGLAIYGNSVRNSRETVLKADLVEMRKAIDAYYADKQKYPATLEALVTDHYLRAIPVDPITNAADWETKMSDRDPANPSAEPGIAEVKSKADGTSISGTPYSEL